MDCYGIGARILDPKQLLRLYLNRKSCNSVEIVPEMRKFLEERT